MQTDTSPPGSKITPKALAIVYDAELGKPYALLVSQGINSARGRDGVEGRGKE